jgi:hypothetical protein
MGYTTISIYPHIVYIYILYISSLGVSEPGVKPVDGKDYPIYTTGDLMGYSHEAYPLVN